MAVNKLPRKVEFYNSSKSLATSLISGHSNAFAIKRQNTDELSIRAFCMASVNFGLDVFCFKLMLARCHK